MRLTGDIVTSNANDSSTHVSDLYSVLDTPKSPMSPAWVTVLEKSCDWARGQYTNSAAVTSVGDYPLKAQRSHTLGLGYYFDYNTIVPAGTTYGPSKGTWNYHQFAIDPTAGVVPVVWDGCLTFHDPTSPTGYILGLARDSTYKGGAADTGLVYSYGYGSWGPAPASGFLAAVTTLSLPGQ